MKGVKNEAGGRKEGEEIPGSVVKSGLSFLGGNVTANKVKTSLSHFFA